MDKFTTLTGVAAPLPITNIDTDMIIPKQYLKTIARTGLGSGLFSELRFKEDGSENPDFVLNKPAYRKATIIVAEDNFGCGSSREHASRGANATLSIDLAKQEITGPDGGVVKFDIDESNKHCLLNGLDAIGLTLVKESKITSFEEKHNKHAWA